MNDGAIHEFHHSETKDLNLFLMEDIQGAMFFHPLLSAALGALCGIPASGLAMACSGSAKKAIVVLGRRGVHSKAAVSRRREE
jgi:hypothetical protein